jgi:hypothetical protein
MEAPFRFPSRSTPPLSLTDNLNSRRSCAADFSLSCFPVFLIKTRDRFTVPEILHADSLFDPDTDTDPDPDC